MTQAPVPKNHSCPFCKTSVPLSEKICQHCGAVRYKGFSIIETLASTLVGLVVFSAFSTMFVPLSLWTILFAILGLATGFLIGYYQFPVKKWTAPR